MYSQDCITSIRWKIAVKRAHQSGIAVWLSLGETSVLPIETDDPLGVVSEPFVPRLRLPKGLYETTARRFCWFLSHPVSLSCLEAYHSLGPVYFQLPFWEISPPWLPHFALPFLQAPDLDVWLCVELFLAVFATSSLMFFFSCRRSWRFRSVQRP